MKLRVLIADDEVLARDRLRQLLRGEPGVEIVAECINGTEVAQSIREKAPNLAFLDVRMPELDGLAAVRALDGTSLPVIIFVTASKEFAADAFEVQAVDYLLKPFDRERFNTALRRARQRLHAETTPNLSSVSALLSNLTPRLKSLEHVTVRCGTTIKPLKVTEIDWISAADNYVELHIGAESHLLRKTISAMTGGLRLRHFVRISRSTIVNLERIREISPTSHGDFVVRLRNGIVLRGTRNYRHNLADFLGNIS